MSGLKHLRTVGAIAIGGMLPTMVGAWDGSVQASVGLIEISASAAFSFRVSMTGSPSMCGAGTHAWAYLHEGTINYKALVAELIAAKHAGNTVIVYSNRDSSGNCAIGHIISYPS